MTDHFGSLGSCGVAKRMALDTRSEERRLLFVMRDAHRLTLSSEYIKGDSLASEKLVELVCRAGPHVICKLARSVGIPFDTKFPHDDHFGAAGGGA